LKVALKETRFIEQNREKWQQYETILQEGRPSPEHLKDLYIQVTDDLSYARTYYPNRSVRVYTNRLAQRVLHLVHQGKQFKWSRLLTFWTEVLPKAIWESRKAMLLATAIFFLSFGIGVLSSQIDPDFARLILGDDYVDITLRNIEQGDPMAVYKDDQTAPMFWRISTNNLFVMLRTALFGVLASIGTLFLAVYNGIMVGTFQYFFIAKGLFWESFLTIWIHGTLEIGALIISSGAGLVMGSGLLFPGTYTRSQAFKLSMRRGITIFIGLVPIVILAAIFETYLTRFTDAPDVLRGLFILFSFLFMVGYFALFPWILARKGRFEHMDESNELPPQNLTTIDLTLIKNAGEVVTDSFVFLTRNLGYFIGWSMFFALIYSSWVVWRGGEHWQLESEVLSEASHERQMLAYYTGDGFGTLQRWLLIVCFAALAHLTLRRFTHVNALVISGNSGVKGSLIRLLNILFVTPLLLLAIDLLGGFMLTNSLFASLILSWIMLSLPLVLTGLWGAYSWFSPNRDIMAVTQGNNIGKVYLVGLFFFSLLNMGFWFIGSMLFEYVLQFLGWLVPESPDSAVLYRQFAQTLGYGFMVMLVWTLIFVCCTILWFSNYETYTATHLKSAANQLGTARQIRGLPRE
jgi:uncharacterized membrane protein SpoIIM required for sporulation